jgi:putative effector of murein hydrolase
VALAVPIYNQRARLRTVALPLVCGAVLGTLASITVSVGLAALSGLAPVVVHSLAMKSVTTAVAVELARLDGGDPALAAVFVVTTASIGATIGPWLLGRCRVEDAAARGIALGTVAAAMGTAAAWREDELAGALGGLAIFVTALATTLLLPAYLPGLLWLART